jgi:UDP-N-acetylglucosamine 2-epimerase (non-hydrolysing)
VFERARRDRPRISVVAAARPNFMKVAPIIRALDGRADVELVHTGQHYDERMSQGFFEDLQLPKPDVNLAVGSGTHAEQTAAVMVAYERYLLARDVDAVVVVGDVNSTVACAMAAVKLHVPVAHVEAGLRARDWAMPEEVNRLLTDRISRWLLTTSADADANLVAEGVAADWIHLVGNTMIDTLLANLARAQERGARARDEFGLSGAYGVLTLHRPSNVDAVGPFQRLIDAITDVATELPFVFPTHPRTASKLAEFGTALPPSVRVVEPLGYLDFIGLVDGAALVLTDSGGVQEETSVLGVPCLTLRENTERPVTCTLGTNRLVGTDPSEVRAAVGKALDTPRQPAHIPSGMAAPGNASRGCCSPTSADRDLC